MTINGGIHTAPRVTQNQKGSAATNVELLEKSNLVVFPVLMVAFNGGAFPVVFNG